MKKLITIVETRQFASDCSGILSEDEVDDLKVFLSANPEAGVVIPGSGGIRKLRWAATGRGKRGGSRVIYYFLDSEAPLFLIAVYAKSRKADLDADELKAARQFAEAIAKEHRKRS
jgi:mRNA-degrading endonuclease RelE of RelBE toxin-antitoxin system